MRALIRASVVAVMLGVACRDDGPSGVPVPDDIPVDTPVAARTPASEDALARSMLLVIRDLPVGWAEIPPTPRSWGACDPLLDGTVTGKAESGAFTRGGSSTGSVTERVVIHAKADDVTADYDDLATQLDCLTENVNAGKFDEPRVTYSAASAVPLSFPALGDRSVAYRVKIHVKAKGQPGGDSDGFLDVVYVSMGRVGLRLDATDTSFPFDSPTLRRIAEKAVAKLRQP
jgi:hypothetical protein